MNIDDDAACSCEGGRSCADSDTQCSGREDTTPRAREAVQEDPANQLDPVLERGGSAKGPLGARVGMGVGGGRAEIGKVVARLVLPTAFSALGMFA